MTKDVVNTRHVVPYSVTSQKSDHSLHHNHDDITERQFVLNGFTYAAKLWRKVSGTIESSQNINRYQKEPLPIIALHGLLDNSGSFDVLMPLLNYSQCLAIDLSGHGLSDHKPGLDDYPLWSEVSSVYAIADQMGWDKFTLIGHSRGAMMSLLMSGVCPERIEHLVMLDSMLPPAIEHTQAAERMIKSRAEIQRRLNRKMSLYDTYNDAITARCNSRYAIVTRPTAELLAQRGLRELDGQFHWHADGKLWAPSSVALSSDMVNTFVENIKTASVPTCLLLAEQGLLPQMKKETSASQWHHKTVEQLSTQVHRIDDGHFLHMEKAAEEVAGHINRFLSPT